MRAQPLDDTFLSRFARQTWERKPLVARNIRSSLLELDSAEVFKLVVKAADRSRREKTLLGFKFYANGIRSSDVETLFVLPRKSDQSFEGYNERMERMYQDYCLVCDELLQVNKDKQALLTKFTHQLYRHVGFPNRFAEMGLYLGNYRKTPFGVHRDACGVFSFPVVGKKTFRAWTSAYVAQNPALEQSFKYPKHKAASVVLSADAGDMIYWPSSSWHIAESDGSFSATWSLGVWVDHPTEAVLSKTLMTLLSSKMKSSLNLPVVFENGDSTSGVVRNIPEIFEEAVSALKSLTRGELASAFRATWLNRLAEGGLKTQAAVDETYSLGKIVRLRGRPIFWCNDGGSQFIYAFSDSGTQTSNSAKLLALIKSLNAGQSCAVKNYSASDLRAIRALGAAGAFV